jgi:hypothetical protein
MPDGSNPEARSDKVRQLAEMYVDAAVKWADAISKMYVNRANDLVEVMGETEEKLLREGVPGQEALAHLMKHENPNVRYWAATGSLPFAMAEAVATLEELKHQKGILGLDAEIILRKWRADGARN